MWKFGAVLWACTLWPPPHHLLQPIHSEDWGQMPRPGWKACEGSPNSIPRLCELKEAPQAWAGWKGCQSNKKRFLKNCLFVCCSLHSRSEKVTGSSLHLNVSKEMGNGFDSAGPPSILRIHAFSTLRNCGGGGTHWKRDGGRGGEGVHEASISSLWA